MLKIVDNFYNEIINKVNNDFDFELYDEVAFSSFKAHVSKGKIKVYDCEKVGVLGMFETTSLFRQARTLAFTFAPIYIDGPLMIYEYHIRGNIHSVQIKIFDTFLNKKTDYKALKNKALIAKRRFNTIQDRELLDKGNGKILFDWSIGKKVYRKDAIELIKISNMYISGYLEFLKTCEKCKGKEKKEIVNKFVEQELINSAYVFNVVRKNFGEEKGNEWLSVAMGKTA